MCFLEKVGILHPPQPLGLEIHKAGIESMIKKKTSQINIKTVPCCEFKKGRHQAPGKLTSYEDNFAYLV